MTPPFLCHSTSVSRRLFNLDLSFHFYNHRRYQRARVIKIWAEMPQQWKFFSLPRELRNIIYEYYVLEDGGYHFNYESGKLRTASNQPVDLSFMYTCALVATEMRGVALGTNTITFSTAYSDSERIKAGRFSLLLNHLDQIRNKFIWWLSECPELQPFVTPSINAELFRKYPQYVTAQGLEDRASANFVPLDEARSTHQDFLDDAFKLLLKDTDFVEALAGVVQPNHSYLSALIRSPLLQSAPIPWNIVSEDEIVEMDKDLPILSCRAVVKNERRRGLLEAGVPAMVCVRCGHSISPI